MGTEPGADAMASFAQQLVDLKAAPESFDPAELDGDLDDDTAAGRRKRQKKTEAINLDHAGKQAPSKKQRLQMRQSIPELSKYAGKKVGRKEVFGSDEVDEDISEDAGDLDSEGADVGDDSDDLEDGGTPEAPSATDLGNFSISGDLEKEYEKMMKKSQTELSVLRAPSAAEVAKKQAEAKQLKQQAAAWSTLVEFRIHLEGALG